MGLVPKSTFMKWARPYYFSNKHKYTDDAIEKGLKQCRTRMIWHFNQGSNVTNRHEAARDEETTTPVGMVTRSNVEDFDDWMVDTAAAELTTNDTRRLSIFPLEQLLLCKERTKLNEQVPKLQTKRRRRVMKMAQRNA